MTFNLLSFDQMLYETINGLAGHWWLLDGLGVLALGNDLIKAGVIGGCFCAAWYAKQDPEQARAARKWLLLSLVACVFVLVTTKTISHVLIAPRPYLLSQKVYCLQSGTLVPAEHVTYRPLLTGTGQAHATALQEGNIPRGDWGTFPSDHAGFFVTLSLGIFLASRGIGVIALAWTFVVILGSKVIAGMHTPLDIAGGAAIAALWLGVFARLARTRWGNPLDWLSRWTMKHAALSAAALFLVVFEAASTLDHIQELGKAIQHHVIH